MMQGGGRGGRAMSRPAEGATVADIDGWEIGLLIVAAYVAAAALVRLMRRRRDQLIAELQDQVEREQKQRQKERGGERRR
jgi:hypothetical protein